MPDSARRCIRARWRRRATAPRTAKPSARLSAHSGDGYAGHGGRCGRAAAWRSAGYTGSHQSGGLADGRHDRRGGRRRRRRRCSRRLWRRRGNGKRGARRSRERGPRRSRRRHGGTDGGGCAGHAGPRDLGRRRPDQATDGQTQSDSDLARHRVLLSRVVWAIDLSSRVGDRSHGWKGIDCATAVSRRTTPEIGAGTKRGARRCSIPGRSDAEAVTECSAGDSPARAAWTSGGQRRSCVPAPSGRCPRFRGPSRPR
jgi:hypothetical protein